MACKITVPLLLAGALSFACNSSSVSLGFTEDDAVLAQAGEQTLAFFDALKTSQPHKLKALYKGFEKFPVWDGSDTAVVKETRATNHRITVVVENSFANAQKQPVTKQVQLFFKRQPGGGLSLVDSKGLASFPAMEEYRLGVQTGCINKTTDTTDQQILSALQKTKRLLPEIALNVYVELKQRILVDDWTWDLNADGAFGDGVVRNNAAFAVPRLKYRLVYNNRHGDTLAIDEGYASYNELLPGQSQPFTFFTDGVRGATKASLELVFDDELVFRQLAQKRWTGRECAAFFRTGGKGATE